MLVLALLTVWLAAGERLPSWLAGEREIPVRIVRVTKQTVPESVRMSGVLMAVNEVQVVSRLAGRITELRLKVGDPVRAGSLVAKIYASDIAQRQIDLEAALRTARRDLSEKESQLASAEKAAARRQELFEQDLIARRDVEQAVTALQTIRAEAGLARAHLAQQEAMSAQAFKIQSLSQVTAPSSGVVSRRWAEPGRVIAESSPLVSIANGNLMKFTGRITGLGAAMVREGLSAVVVANERADGIVSRVIASGDKDEASAEVEIQIKTAGTGFRFGMAADAIISLDRSAALWVPQKAIVASEGKHYLYKFEQGRALRQEVRLGAKVGNEVVVELGLRSSDLVIVENLRSLKPGSRVRAAIVAVEGNASAAK